MAVGISKRSKLKSQIKSENKKGKVKAILHVGIGALTILGGLALLMRKKQTIIKKLDIKHEIAMEKIMDLEEKLKREKVLHQILIKNLNDKQDDNNKKSEEFKKATINKNFHIDKINRLTKELDEVKNKKQQLEELIKKYENIKNLMDNDLQKFIKSEKFLITELQNKDKKIDQLRIHNRNLNRTLNVKRNLKRNLKSIVSKK